MVSENSLWRRTFGKPILHQEWLVDGRSSLELEHDERKATWSELFFDLAYVAAISKLGASFREKIESGFHHDEGFRSEQVDFSVGAALGDYIAMFCPLFVHWTSTTLYHNRFNNNDATHHLFTMLNTMFITFLSANIIRCDGNEYDVATGDQSFRDCAAWSYFLFGAKLTLCLMFLRVALYIQKARSYAFKMVFVLGISACIYLASAIADHYINWPGFISMWWIALAWDFTAPFIIAPLIFPYFRKGFIPVNIELLSERFGLLLIIGLGESIVAASAITLGDLAGSQQYMFYFFSFAIVAIASLFKLTYFDVGRVLVEHESSHALRWSRWAGAIWLWTHLPLIGAVVLSASFFELIIATNEINSSGRWILCGSLCLVLSCMTIIQLTHDQSSTREKFRRLSRSWRILARTLGSIVIVLLPIVPEKNMEPWQLVLIILLVITFLTSLDLFGSTLESKQVHHHEDQPLLDSVGTPHQRTDSLGLSAQTNLQTDSSIQYQMDDRQANISSDSDDDNQIFDDPRMKFSGYRGSMLIKGALDFNF